MSPLKELFTHMKVITHSKQPHRYRGIFFEGDARITRSAHIIGKQMRLMNAWSLISLKTPLPLVLFATWRCHNKFIFSGKPRIMLAMHIIERDIWWSLKSSIMACSHSDEQLAEEELSFIFKRFDSNFPFQWEMYHHHHKSPHTAHVLDFWCLLITSERAGMRTQKEWESQTIPPLRHVKSLSRFVYRVVYTVW